MNSPRLGAGCHGVPSLEGAEDWGLQGTLSSLLNYLSQWKPRVLELVFSVFLSGRHCNKNLLNNGAGARMCIIDYDNLLNDVNFFYVQLNQFDKIVV